MSDEEDTLFVKVPLSLRSPRLAASLVVLSGAAVGRVIRLDKPSLTLGRSSSCDVFLDDDGVSRLHATISQDGRDFVFEDCHSRNGSWVNGSSVTKHRLTPGEQIQLGAITVLKFGLQDELEQQVQTHLYEAAVRDLMTRLYNRRYFDEELARAVSHATRHDAPLSLLVVDIDHFKLINDRLGHAAGDQVLREVAARCRGAIRNEDVLCRIGGEEFAVIARSTPWQNALILGQRLRRAVCEIPTRHEGEVFALSISVGVAGLTEASQRSAPALLAAADRFLYEAKLAGRNTVCGPEP